MLNQHSVVELLEKRFPNAEEMGRELKQLEALAQPSVSLNQTRLGDRRNLITLRSAVVVNYPPGRDSVFSGAPTATAIQELDMAEKTVSIGDPYRLSLVTVRHGLPLFIVPEIATSVGAYERYADTVHTAQDGLILSDITGGYEATPADPALPIPLNANRALALALAFSESPVLTLDAVLYADDASDINANGHGDSAFDKGAGYYLVYVDPEEQRIAEYLRRTPRRTYAFLGINKPAACRTLSNDRTLYAHLYAALREYFNAEPYMTPEGWHGLANFLYDRMIATDPKPDEWEARELRLVLPLMQTVQRPVA